MTMPWLLHSLYSVALITGIVAIGAYASKYFAYTKKMFAPCLNVQRLTFGAPLFGLSFFIMYILSADNKTLYLICCSILTFADTAAALVGTRFPVGQFKVLQSHKSISGCIAFFLTSSICILIPLVSLGHFNISTDVNISVYLASIITCIEAIAVFGLDNLFIPISAFYLLQGLV